jgi:two-component system, LytTR family, response regulator
MSTRRSVAEFPTEASQPTPVPGRKPASVRVLLVDHEPLAREWLRWSLEREAGVEVVGECGDGVEAVAAIRRQAPDVVFLEVDLPGLDGFGVLQAAGGGDSRGPSFVFVTAEERHAVRAFEAGVLDYVLKPVDGDRILAAVRRARQQRDVSADADRMLPVLLAARREARDYPEWLLVKENGRSVFVRIADIDWIESARNNVVLHVGPRRHTLRETTSSMEARVDPRRFLRIHRSAIVQIDRVQSLEPWFNGDYRVTLKDGTKLTLSESYRDRLKEFRRPTVWA